MFDFGNAFWTLFLFWRNKVDPNCWIIWWHCPDLYSRTDQRSTQYSLRYYCELADSRIYSKKSGKIKFAKNSFDEIVSKFSQKIIGIRNFKNFQLIFQTLWIIFYFWNNFFRIIVFRTQNFIVLSIDFFDIFDFEGQSPTLMFENCLIQFI